MIEFRELNDSKEDYLKLYNWCQNKDVYEWFEQRKLSYDEIVNKYKKKLIDKIEDLYIVMLDNNDIGLVQVYKFNNDININLDKYKNIYEYDIFIGDSDYLNKGIGKKIVSKTNDYIYSKYDADAIILRPFERNIRAIKCYQKSSFEIIYKYMSEDTLGNKETIILMINTRIKQ